MAKRINELTDENDYDYDYDYDYGLQPLRQLNTYFNRGGWSP